MAIPGETLIVFGSGMAILGAKSIAVGNGMAIPGANFFPLELSNLKLETLVAM